MEIIRYCFIFGLCGAACKVFLLSVTMVCAQNYAEYGNNKVFLDFFVPAISLFHAIDTPQY
jgi:hypothetical protein